MAKSKNLGAIILLLLMGGLLTQAYAFDQAMQVVLEPPDAQTYLSDFQARSLAVPARDDYAIFNRLKGDGENPNPSRTTTKPTYKLGDQEAFWVHDLQQKSYYQVQATLIALTPHLYMFLDNAYKQNLAALRQVAQRFEDEVYPTNHRYFGEEWSPGVDNDPRIVILNTPLQLATGYFSSEDELLKSVNPRSNEREMFYVGSNPENVGNYLSLLSHEFQHMIHSHTAPTQEVWINEGMSVLAQTINGYSSSGYEGAFFSKPERTQLNSWTCSSCGTIRHYGAGYLWVSYIEDRFGAETVRAIANNRQGLAGFNAVDYALAKTVNPSLDSAQLFHDWVAANYLNRRIADLNYAYKKVNQAVSNPPRLAVGSVQQGTINQYAAQYFRVQAGTNGFTLAFQGAPTARLTDTTLNDGTAWWSNRADAGNTQLTRNVDLTTVSSATLKFSLWFDIEAKYDFLYVEVSDNDGKTWQVLNGKYSVPNNSSGKDYGAGYSGHSATDVTDLADTEDTAAEWVQESLDLSRFAGKKIKLRFEYISDEGYTRQGALIDNIEIPEIGWRDEVENDDGGWEAEGFFRTNNQVLQHYVVRVIRQDGACGLAATTNLATADNGQSCIKDVILSNTNSGQQSFPYQEAIVIVAPYAPKTLVPAPYNLKIEK